MIEMTDIDHSNRFYSAVNNEAIIMSGSMGNNSEFETELSYIDALHAKFISIDIPVGGSYINIMIPIDLITELVDLINLEKETGE